MRKVTIAFDVDGTLISNVGVAPQTKPEERPVTVPNRRIVDLLQTLASMKNTRVIVWSGGGKEYAETWVRRLGIAPFVDAVHGKVGCPERPDIAVDDVQSCGLGDVNLIVREK